MSAIRTRTDRIVTCLCCFGGRSSSGEPRSVRRLSSRIAWGACLVAATVLAGGCNGETPPKPEGERAAQVDEDAEGLERCDEMLDNALSMLHPSQVGISADRNDAVSLLNTWLRCGLSDDEALPGLPAATRQALEPLLSDEELARVGGENFSVRDGSHITSALLLDRIAEHASQKSQNQLDRAVDLFYYVARNVAVVGPPIADAELTLFDVLLLGQGSVNDRVWAFAELLRQLQIDAVILHPQADDDPAAARPLVGVLLDGQVYLFDPALGLPVPAAGERSATVPRRPATLAEAIADPQLLSRLAPLRDQPYPWQADSLKNPRVGLIGNTSLWSPAMRRLQTSLTGDRSAIVAEDFQDTARGPGTLSRVTTAGDGHWDRSDISLWPYPEQQMEAVEAPGAAQEIRSALLSTFDVPVPFTLTEDEGLSFGRPERSQWQTRVTQLLGDYAKASSSYLAIRLHTVFPQQLLAILPQDFVQINYRAGEDAFFWGGVVKFEQGEHEVAATIFGDYMRRYPEPYGVWRETAQYLQGRSLLELGERLAAAQALANPIGDRSRLLLEALK